MARHGVRRHRRPFRPSCQESPPHYRLRSDSLEPARRKSLTLIGRASTAVWAFASCHRRGGTGMIGDPSGKSPSVCCCRPIRSRKRRQRSSNWNGFISAPRRTPRGWSTMPNGRAYRCAVVSARDRQAFHRRYMLQKESVSRRSRARKAFRSPSSVTSSCRRDFFRCSIEHARCRWAAVIGGATSRRVSI